MMFLFWVAVFLFCVWPRRKKVAPNSGRTVLVAKDHPSVSAQMFLLCHVSGIDSDGMEVVEVGNASISENTVRCSFVDLPEALWKEVSVRVGGQDFSMNLPDCPASDEFGNMKLELQLV